MRTVKNYIKGLLYQKRKAESDMSSAESVFQAVSKRYCETKSPDDLTALMLAAEGLQVVKRNLQWQLRKIEELQNGRWIDGAPVSEAATASLSAAPLELLSGF